jgi:hypothetical protein
MGRGDASIFWYWFFDSELKFHHEFETMDLIEGEKVYREVEWKCDGQSATAKRRAMEQIAEFRAILPQQVEAGFVWIFEAERGVTQWD